MKLSLPAFVLAFLLVPAFSFAQNPAKWSLSSGSKAANLKVGEAASVDLKA